MPNPDKLPQRVTILQGCALIEELEGSPISQQGLRKCLKHWEVPVGKDHRVNTAAMLDARRKGKEADKTVIGGKNADLTRRKIGLQCRKLEVQIDALLAELVPVQELYAEVDEVVGLLNAGLEEWVQWVTVETRNAALYKKAKAIRDRVKLALKAKCERS